MRKVRIAASELHDTDVEFVSLVKRGANRIPLRITKADNGQEGTVTIDLSTHFRKEDDKAKTAKAETVQKAADIEAAKAALEAAGFTVTKADAPAGKDAAKKGPDGSAGGTEFVDGGSNKEHDPDEINTHGTTGAVQTGPKVKGKKVKGDAPAFVKEKGKAADGDAEDAKDNGADEAAEDCAKGDAGTKGAAAEGAKDTATKADVVKADDIVAAVTKAMEGKFAEIAKKIDGVVADMTARVEKAEGVAQSAAKAVKGAVAGDVAGDRTATTVQKSAGGFPPLLDTSHRRFSA